VNQIFPFKLIKGLENQISSEMPLKRLIMEIN